jgi:hypothetical protein
VASHAYFLSGLEDSIFSSAAWILRSTFDLCAIAVARLKDLGRQLQYSYTKLRN